MTSHDDEYIPNCVYCGDPLDYCPGHPDHVRAIIAAHFSGIHARCNPAGCEEAAAVAEADRLVRNA